MSNQYVKQIDDYLIKDEEARNNISTLTNKSNEQTAKINEHTDAIEALTNANNTTGANVGVLQETVNSHSERISTLENLTHLKLTYNSSTETITFK